MKFNESESRTINEMIDFVLRGNGINGLQTVNKFISLLNKIAQQNNLDNSKNDQKDIINDEQKEIE